MRSLGGPISVTHRGSSAIAIGSGPNSPGGVKGSKHGGGALSKSEGTRFSVIMFAFIVIVGALGLFAVHLLIAPSEPHATVLSAGDASPHRPQLSPGADIGVIIPVISSVTNKPEDPLLLRRVNDVEKTDGGKGNTLTASVPAPDDSSSKSKATPLIRTSTAPPTLTVATVKAETGAPKRKSVAFAITITSDGKVVDGACVLLYSIVKTHMDSDLDVSFVAFVHPTVVEARGQLQRLGYQIVETETPVNTSAIRGKFLREHINDKAGCCGARELIKLNAYRLVQFDWVVHVDVDVIIIKSLEAMLRTMPTSRTSVLYTTDPNMASNKAPDKQPAQGGFLVLRPSYADFTAFLDVFIEGDYRSGSAWGGSGIGWCWGGKTIQGVVPYYYNRVTEKGRSIVLDRCYYNSMADTPNCSTQQVDELYSAHFTVCQKPWSCSPRQDIRLCADLHKRWFELRTEAEAFYSHPITTGPLCAKGRNGFPRFDVSQASLPASFGARFNRVSVESELKPLCAGGFAEGSCVSVR